MLRLFPFNQPLYFFIFFFKNYLSNKSHCDKKMKDSIVCDFPTEASHLSTHSCAHKLSYAITVSQRCIHIHSLAKYPTFITSFYLDCMFSDPFFFPQVYMHLQWNICLWYLHPTTRCKGRFLTKFSIINKRLIKNIYRYIYIYTHRYAEIRSILSVQTSLF